MPDPKDTVAYNLYKEARGLSNDRCKEYRRAAPAMISVMLEGCMKQDSITRMERIHIEKEIPEIRRTNDVLKLRQLMINITTILARLLVETILARPSKSFMLGPNKRVFQKVQLSQDAPNDPKKAAGLRIDWKPGSGQRLGTTRSDYGKLPIKIGVSS